jgi:hypothetical protein
MFSAGVDILKWVVGLIYIVIFSLNTPSVSRVRVDEANRGLDDAS